MTSVFIALRRSRFAEEKISLCREHKVQGASIRFERVRLGHRERSD